VTIIFFFGSGRATGGAGAGGGGRGRHAPGGAAPLNASRAGAHTSSPTHTHPPTHPHTPTHTLPAHPRYSLTAAFGGGAPVVHCVTGGGGGGGGEGGQEGVRALDGERWLAVADEREAALAAISAVEQLVEMGLVRYDDI
jgi:hypothetical protein